jgi:hypothetical protein
MEKNREKKLVMLFLKVYFSAVLKPIYKGATGCAIGLSATGYN